VVKINSFEIGKYSILLLLLILLGFSLLKFINNDNTSFDRSKSVDNFNSPEKMIRNTYGGYIDAGLSCDKDKAYSLITNKSSKIVNFTCANMAAEAMCYNKDRGNIEIFGDQAIIYTVPFSYKNENPIFFLFENGDWKLDLYAMSLGLTMIGSECDSGWRFSNIKLKDRFCLHFKAGMCPAD